LYELFLRARDGYCMDRAMQQHFSHGLPAVKSQQYQNKPRIVIVFRHGQQKMIKRNTGRPVTSLAPRLLPLPRVFGHLAGLKEGYVYSMKQLKEMNAHSNTQAGVSGNKTEGCDSIIISRKQQGDGGDDHDCLLEFLYTGVQRNFGGLCLDQSIALGLPVRVVRSSMLKTSIYCALMPHGKNTPTLYQYDGLYYATFLHEEPCNHPTKPSYRTYRLLRSSGGDCLFNNRTDTANYVRHCVKLGTMSDKAFSNEASVAHMVNTIPQRSTAHHT
jgi:SAD/SRA domain